MNNSSLNTNSKSQVLHSRKQGKTFREISKTCNIPLSTVHLWSKHIQLTSKQQALIKYKHKKALTKGRKKLQQRQKRKRLKEKKLYINQGKKLIGNINTRELLLIGAALYWAEGFKKDSRLGFANSDPKMIQLFLKWLIKICNVPKEKIRLRVGVNESYKNNIDEVQEKWLTITDIPLSQFQKPFFQKVKWKKKYPNNKNYLGVLRIRANQQRQLFYKIQGMLKGLKGLKK